MTDSSAAPEPSAASLAAVAHLDPPRPARAEINVHGNSGCQVAIRTTAGRVFISKAALDASYNTRLAVQIEKQRSAQQANGLAFVRIPKIIRTYPDDELFHADMEYVYFNDSLSYFGTASRSSIGKVVDMVVAYVDEEIASSPIQAISSDVFLAKLESVASTLTRAGVGHLYSGFIGNLTAKLDSTRRLLIPLGRCHGDLTFSNILIASDASAVAVIDFLDSFVESPLVDLAKLRQDTKFRWSMLMSATEIDKIRFGQIMKHIDGKITEKYGREGWYAENINIMLCMNMLRIAPYAKSRAVHDFLQKSLENLELMHD